MKLQVSFSLNFASLFNVMGDNPSYLIFNFIIFSTTVQNFRLSTAQVKFHQICTLIGYFCWKCIKFQLKKVWTSCISWYQRVVQNLKRNFFFASKITRIWWIFIRTLKSLKNLHFDWSLSCKAYNVWPKKITEEHISWHWRVM